MKIKTVKDKAVKLAKDYVAPVPRWAKILRNVGVITTAIGGGILASPALFGAGLITAASYMVFGGNAAILIFQGFKKTK